VLSSQRSYNFKVKGIVSVLFNSGDTVIYVTDDMIRNDRPHSRAPGTNYAYDIGAFELSTRPPKFQFKGDQFELKGDFEFR